MNRLPKQFKFENEVLEKKGIKWREVRIGGVYLGQTSSPFVQHTFNHQVSKYEIAGIALEVIMKEKRTGQLIEIEYGRKRSEECNDIVFCFGLYKIPKINGYSVNVDFCECIFEVVREIWKD